MRAPSSTAGRRLALAGFLVGAVVVLGTARADEADVKKACLSAFDRAQQLRAGTKLRDAREALIECSKDACPMLVRKDCAQWMGEVTASLPSVVFGAQGAAGEDLVAVRVSVDGVPVQDKLDGRAIAVDPGPHVVRFERPDGAASEQQVLVREGEKNRPVLARLGAPTAVAPPVLLPSAPPGAPAPSTPWNAIVGVTSGVAGLGLLAAALGFDVTATSEAHALPCAAARNCTDAEVAPPRQKYLFADVFLGVGAATLAFGVVVLAARPFRGQEPARIASPVHLDTAVGPSGGGARVTVDF